MTRRSTAPLAGIIAGMDRAEALGASHVISVAVDRPYFPVVLAARLSSAGCALAQSTEDGQMHPTFGNLPVALPEHLADAADILNFGMGGFKSVKVQ